MGKHDASMNDLGCLSATLNSVSDQLTEQLSNVESGLNSLRLGVSASVELSRQEAEDAAGDDYISCLEYGKHNGKWGLLICSGPEGFEDAWIVSTLRDAPREVRILAVDKLPSLLEALAAAARKLADDARSKVEHVKKIASDLS